MFRFKQFNIDQTGCAMKVNTDATLLGAITDSPIQGRILEIGTGSGVIAMMISQRCPQAEIDAVEIDGPSAEAARRNFLNSPFPVKPRIFRQSFQEFLAENPWKYDVIVSNPPYFLNALTSDSSQKNIARHTDHLFFQELIAGAESRLTEQGELYLILPIVTAQLVLDLSRESKSLKLKKQILIKSFPGSQPFRTILVLNRSSKFSDTEHFVIYSSQNVYSAAYTNLLREYLIIF